MAEIEYRPTRALRVARRLFLRAEALLIEEWYDPSDGLDALQFAIRRYQDAKARMQ